MKNALLSVVVGPVLLFVFSAAGNNTSAQETERNVNAKAPKLVALKSDEPQALAFDGGTARFLVSGDDTNGAWSLVEEVEPPGAKTAWHRHNYSDQAYYILEGTLTAKVADTTHELRPGAFILIPRGTPHAQGNFGTTPVRFLQINTPAGFEEFLKGRVELFKTMKPDHPEFSKRMAEIRKKVDSEVLGVWHPDK